MSRVIKFRVWDKADKEYMILGSTGLDARNGDVIDYYNEGNRLGGSEEYDIEQYTGLTDKNGKEIYEGDILGNEWGNGYISWCDKCKQFQYYISGECMACSGDVQWYELVEDNGKLEIIGNVHEDPELKGDRQ